ncbi:nucleoside-diphosphate sugar epimerase/dehydratase [Bacillus wiedmannii]|uniref:nucleoside-diphosphate sugar epimerase/dehydratase n=1 Tax=Bacillus wiedmannii TaxID=1890302 RepID=UPI000BEFCC19|nr:nucleoside-diphosphate sugar epimerase/dehydratase [Bacillus wiedmannii]PEO38852.1 polysaccharide biosynthesis protein [Bacillus wiedmannii]
MIKQDSTNAEKRTLIIGAGEASRMLIYQLQQKETFELKPVAILDDDVSLYGQNVWNVEIVGTIADIQNIVQLKRIEHIIIAIPSLEKTKKNEIIRLCVNTGIQTEVLPDIDAIICGRKSLLQREEINYTVFLDREEHHLDYISMKNHFDGKTVIITGAGGSIGSELSRQILQCQPRSIILLGHGENSIFRIYKELQKNRSETHLIPVIGDIKDAFFMDFVFQLYSPDIVYHAAAHKHVTLMEDNPLEAIQNNIMGTKNIVHASKKHKVKKFIMISTDKAVQPTSIMGATKKIAEWIVQQQNQETNHTTTFSVVRFGNVLGSRGSALPLFWNQIHTGAPITLTHPEVERYFMTIPEASKLVIEASWMSLGGEVFILDMGKPQKLRQMIHKMIRLAGKKTSDVQIKYIGLSKGEKLSEELFESTERIVEKHEKTHIYRVVSQIPDGVDNIDVWLEEVMKFSKEDMKYALLQVTSQQTIYQMERTIK